MPRPKRCAWSNCMDWVTGSTRTSEDKPMKNTRKHRKNSSQAGVALLVALIALLLITGVALAMIVASGSEGALNGNYRSSSSSYYAAMAGIEEGRGRLLPTSANTIVGVGNIPLWGNTMTVTQVQYIMNPNTAAGEAVGTILATYPDTQYDAEFGAGKLAAASKGADIQSRAASNAANIPGPMFKWVRINPVTEFSLKMDVNNDGVLDQANVLYYDTSNTPPSLTKTPSSTNNQV